MKHHAATKTFADTQTFNEATTARAEKETTILSPTTTIGTEKKKFSRHFPMVFVPNSDALEAIASGRNAIATSYLKKLERRGIILQQHKVQGVPGTQAYICHREIATTLEQIHILIG